MMYFQAVILLWHLLLLPLVSSIAQEWNPAYNEAIAKAINFKEIKKKIQQSLWDTDEGREVALKMLDASAKIPNGILAGNLYDLGNFDECYDLKYEDIYGKYCLGTLQLSNLTENIFDSLKINSTSPKLRFFIHPEPRTAGVGLESIAFYLAICVPSNWSIEDIPGLLTYSEDFCYTKATEAGLSSGAIATIVILALVLAIVVMSTVFDLVLYYKEKQSPHELFVAFSAWSNGRKIFKSVTNSDQLLCLNGIKAISMMWVIIGHEYSSVSSAPLTNIFDAVEFQQDVKNMFIFGATVSVDTFFVVGGLVTVYTFLKSMDRGVKFNIFLYYLHRYLRLTPAFAIMILIYLYLLNHFGNGPLWAIINLSLVKSCENAWWSSLLYITNYVGHDNCVPQTWYLSVDMQLFILSPIVLIPLSKWPKQALILLGFLTVAGCVVPFAIGYAENLVQWSEDSMYDYYIQTYTRFGPYVIGMILGYFIYKVKKSKLEIRLSKLIVCISWLICLTGLVACVYAGHPLNVATEEDKWGNSLFLAFNRPAWSVALSGVIFLCVSGYGGPIDAFLSLPIFQILTKLSYCMYLIHLAVISVRFSIMRNGFHFSHLNIMHVFWGDFIFTFVLSVFLCLSFESPIIILEKHLFGKGANKAEVRQKKPEV